MPALMRLVPVQMPDYFPVMFFKRSFIHLEYPDIHIRIINFCKVYHDPCSCDVKFIHTGLNNDSAGHIPGIIPGLSFPRQGITMPEGEFVISQPGNALLVFFVRKHGLHSIMAMMSRDQGSELSWKGSLRLERNGLKIINGRFHSREFASDSGSIVINETAVRNFNIEDPLSCIFVKPEPDKEENTCLPVTGVMRDIPIEARQSEVLPFIILNNIHLKQVPHQGSYSHSHCSPESNPEY
jgi:hypothetical protein